MSLALLAAMALGAVDAPVTSVTVYSDRARVTRTASLQLSGVQKLELPLLLDTVDRSSIRVESTGAEVKRVDITPVEDDQLEPGEARQLLTRLEQLDDRLAASRGELAAHQAQLQALQRLAPAVPPGEPLKSPPRLNASGWSLALAFVQEQSARLQTRARQLSQQIEELEEQRAQAVEKAQLLGGASRRTGHRVTALVSGQGPAKVTLSYLALRARWLPVYDLQLHPEAGKVEVRFAGLVSQETGEDWTDAQLVLSTAVPATSTTMPELLSWKIGERERFIPTPRRVQEAFRPPPPAPPLLPAVDEAELLRGRLLAAAGEVSPTPDASKNGERPRKEKRSPERSPSPAAAPAPGEDLAPPPLAQAPAPGFFSFLGAKQEREPQPTTALGLGPPPGYRAPAYSPELPASQAGGYDLSFRSLRSETVGSGKGARRVALFSETWPVAIERKVFPALASDAFLVAEINSPSAQVLPGGSASLFVGADPAGTAQLRLVAPGEAFTLPLGLDRAIRPVRNVELKQAEQGFIGKDELGQYLVTIEVPNPYRSPVAVRVLDQWPVTDDKEVEVKLLETRPSAIQDKVKGSLEWRLTVPARGKALISFTYSIRRPKGWRMHQN